MLRWSFILYVPTAVAVRVWAWRVLLSGFVQVKVTLSQLELSRFSNDKFNNCNEPVVALRGITVVSVPTSVSALMRKSQVRAALQSTSTVLIAPSQAVSSY